MFHLLEAKRLSAGRTGKRSKAIPSNLKSRIQSFAVKSLGTRRVSQRSEKLFVLLIDHLKLKLQCVHPQHARRLGQQWHRRCTNASCYCTPPGMGNLCLNSARKLHTSRSKALGASAIILYERADLTWPCSLPSALCWQIQTWLEAAILSIELFVSLRQVSLIKELS